MTRAGTPIDARPDLRALVLGLVAWGAAWLGLVHPRLVVPAVALVALDVLARRRSGRVWLTRFAWLVAGAAVAASAALHLALVGDSPLTALASSGSGAHAVALVDTDPVPTTGRFGDGAWFDATVVDLTARGRRYRLRAPVLVVIDARIPRVRRGDRVALLGSLHPAESAEQAATFTARTPIVIRAGPGPVERAAARVRRAIRQAAAPMPAGPRALVPSLVDGDHGALSTGVIAAFRITGLTHLLAVSGTNLTLILGALLVLARWVGARARWLLLVGVLGVLGFVALAGPQPSVLRAAAMGTVAVLGLGVRGREQGVRALGVAVLGLLLVDPWLAVSTGFALSAVATAGILVLAPGWRAALARWLPLWVAEAVAVPLAAQIACTPLIAAISGQVSLVAVAANVLAAPFVAPATVLGLAGGLVALISPVLGQVVAAPAGWCGAAILTVAGHGAALPVAAVGWSSGWVSLTLLTLLCAALVLVLRRILLRPLITSCLVVLLVAVMLAPLPVFGWPPDGWVMIACSVGQGDGLVLNAGPHVGVVVDAGPDPVLMDRCLRRLGITSVPVLVLTHFHADHVDGLSGVLHGRRVGQIVTSPLAQPAAGAALVRRLAEAAHIPVRVATYGESTTLGPLHWTVLGPQRTDYPDSDSPPNDASIVMLVEVRGIRILMMADEERPSQAELHHTYPDLHADVLKVAHHGSSKQDEDLVDGLGAKIGVISVGLDNDYGHPAPATLDLLGRAGMRVLRTDLDGDVAITVDASGRVASRTRRVGAAL